MVSTDASTSAEVLHDRISAGGFAIALSGGGHRATLATLGALMAIVDRGLGSKIIQVASVSGGSITNAFVAQRCRLEDVEPGGVDGIASELTSIIIRKGVLTGGWIAILFSTAFILGVTVGLVSETALRALIVSRIGFPPSAAIVLGVLVGAVVAFSVLIFSGLLVEWLLDRRYFRHGIPAKSQRPWGRAKFAALSGGKVDHVFCMTDLVLGLPVYASSQQGGMMWRRLKPERNIHGWMDFQTFKAGEMSIAEVVRASAAFPGISPRRLTIPPDHKIELVQKLPQVAYLADGGLWNNLSTHVLREDGFVGSHTTLDNGVPRPYILPKQILLLCINGSAPLRPIHPWIFKCPGVALVKSLLQTTKILNANTVLPRVEGMKRGFERRVWEGRRPNHLDPADLLVDLSPTEDISDEYIAGRWSEKVIRESDDAVKEWEKNALVRIRNAREHATKSPGEMGWVGFVLGSRPEPVGSYPVVGLSNIEDWHALSMSPDWQQLIGKEGKGRVDAPTTLGRIESSLARQLIARGYLNTYAVSLFLAPLANGEIDRLAKLSDRLDKIVGRGSV